MKILFLGDIVGKSGREVIRDLLPSLRQEYKPQLVICNGENAAHGKGITLRLYKELLSYGIDFITMGNHTYAKKELLNDIDDMNKLIVPYNYIDRKGEGYRIVNINNTKVCIVNLLGQALMGEYMTSPYDAFKAVKEETKGNADIYFVDFHAEATAEKRIFAEYFKDDVDIVVGTHTHIQTADEDILHSKIAFISDVGMCGPYDSIIGRNIEESISSHVLHEKTRYEPCENKPILNAVLIEINDQTNKPIKIERIQIRPKSI